MVLSRRPPVVTWQHVYCGLLSAVYALCIVMGAAFLLFRNELADAQNPAVGFVVMGVIFAGMGLVFALAFGIAPFLRPAPWLWVYHLVLICLGMTSMCCVPFCVPLLIFWIKPETKAYYGRS